MTEFQIKLCEIESTANLLEKSLKLAGLVTNVFSAAGWPLVVVGGSAVEFYTEGAYMSGDIDLCRLSPAQIPLRKAQDLMAPLGATGGPRSWKIAGLFVDLLGFLENEALTPLRTLQTPYGPISLIPTEQALVERILLAHYPQPDANMRDIARKFMAVCLSGATPVDWGEVTRLSALPSFDISRELEILKDEVAGEKI
ncbi:MAG: hypothetical protein V1913_01600 [Fibrobacterota bacterium]